MTTACRDCKFFQFAPTNEREPIIWYYCFCKASPKPPKFDPIFGQMVKDNPEFHYCKDINHGDCNLFERKDTK